MKKGDLVKMRPAVAWRIGLKAYFTDAPCLLLDLASDHITVLYFGRPRLFMKEDWEVV